MIRLIPKLILMMTVFFVVSGVTAYFTVSYFIKNEETVVVPNLVGEDIVNVLELMTHLGLNVRTEKSEYNQDFAKNTVIFQDPKVGEIIKKDRDVHIIVSKGSKILSMPNLKGLDQQQARLILDKNGLAEGHIVKTYYSGTPEDKIIAQYPLSGKEVIRGISIDLLISRGARPKEREMTDLEGLFLDEAVLEAEKNHLVIDTIKTVYEKDKSTNMVLNQKPLPGYHVIENHPVELEVNRNAGDQQKTHNMGNRKNVLFRYRLPPGFLKQHIRLELKTFDTSFVIYDELMAPNREIWVVLPVYTISVIFLYKNGQLIQSEIFD